MEDATLRIEREIGGTSIEGIMPTIPLSQFWSPLLLAPCLDSGLFFGLLGFCVRRLLRGLTGRAGSFAGQFER